MVDASVSRAVIRSMETPLFALRLPQVLQDQIKEMSKVYGSPNPRAFLRELIECVLSGDQAKATAFNVRLVERVTGQLQFKEESYLTAVAHRTQEAHTAQKTQKTQKTQRTQRTQRKKRRLRERTT